MAEASPIAEGGGWVNWSGLATLLDEVAGAAVVGSGSAGNPRRRGLVATGGHGLYTVSRGLSVS